MYEEHIQFATLIKQLNQRAARAVVSQMGLRSTILAEHLRYLFEQPPGDDGSFLAEPVFETTFGWKTAEKTMSDLAGDLLAPELVDALDNPLPELRKDYRFPRTRNPYCHQMESWRALLDDNWRSVLIASGTSSGKTECFLIPILHDLVQEWRYTRRPLIGVRALFLYPLNALINSQHQRLRAWTAPFKGNIRFCLYNGETPEHIQKAEQAETPEQTRSRTLLREEPAPLLITNATMLEYMLVRDKDVPIIQKSEGKLRWIILDEAHTYIGSQAAELTLLLRRVMHAFNVDPDEVRFVATSATIGDGSEGSTTSLQRFLSEVAGVNENRIMVIHGKRSIPEIENDVLEDRNLLNELGQIATKDKGELFDRLAENSTVRQLRTIVSEKARKLSELSKILNEQWGGVTNQQTLTLLELCTQAHNAKGQNFLPLRLHLFERTLAGVWACCNPECSGRTGTILDDSQWKFGKVFINRREFCDHCNAPVFELFTCRQCGTEYLAAEESLTQNGRYLLLPRKMEFDIDEFQLDLDDQEEDESHEEEEERTVDHRGGKPRLLAPMPTNRPDTLDPLTREINPIKPGIPVNLIPPEPGTTMLRCHVCDTVEHKEGKVFRFARLGAPFFLGDILPTLLEFTPQPDDEKRKGPFNGRRLLSFTDSRQGSARIAARLQQDADRNYVRSLLYHHLTENQNGAQTPTELQELQSQIHTLEELVKQHPNLKETLRSLKIQAEELQKPKPKRLTWSEAQEKLAGSKEVRQWMVSEWRRLTGKPIDLNNFADYCLYREFRNRPKFANSAETLGLIALRYPKIERLNESPDIWTQCGGDLNDWKDFLKLIIDYHVRGNAVVDIRDEFIRWMGAKVYRKYIQGPDYVGTTDKKVILWPHCKPKGLQSRFVKLLSSAMNLDPADQRERDIMNMIFREAWIVLSSLFVIFDDGYQLSLAKEAELVSPEKTWICPYTRRLLDTTLKGLSPYIPYCCMNTDICTEINMPKLPYPFWRDEMGAFKTKADIQNWLDSDPLIVNARRANVWPNRSDRVAAKENWYAIAEHSAQQPPIRLRALEKDFRLGRVNILSCSTTMEMGIDIGGLSAVAMNNVPPSPANYLQRAGRAGRRDEATSVSVTLCQQNERGLSIFKDPTWPFETPIFAPSARLDSRKLVQRHVNALLLAEYLHTRVDNIAHLNCTWFFEKNEEDEIPAYDFIAWCESQSTLPSNYAMNGLKKLIRGSILAAQSPQTLAYDTATHIRSVAIQWQGELDALLVEQELIKNQNKNWEDTPAGKGNQRQLHRLREEYLLTELAARGFLPGYGFPTDVVCFVNLTLDMLRQRDQRKNPDNRREDVVTFKQGYPSRELGTAIREFAPSAELVLDGRVYESAGVTLNWHMPPGIDNISEIQALRFIWFCKECGASGTTQSMPQNCMVCSSTHLIPHRYLQPAGFAVDICYEPHNDVSAPKYLPVKPPRITVNETDWTSLPNSELGRYRYSDNGSILHWNAGINEAGYAICLRCGRAAEQEEAGHLPKLFQEEHYRLRGGKESDGGRVCEGSTQEYAILRDLWLAFEARSDVFELQLMNPETKRPVSDKTLAYTVGFGLRRALARHLNIRETEVGVCVQDALATGGQRISSILLYDNVSQGAGYVDELRELLHELLQQTLIVLNCSECDTACHHCLLSIDSQHYADHLNRRYAYNFLQTWLQHYTLPESLKFFGEESKAETTRLRQALLRTCYRPEYDTIQIFLGGNIQDWQISEWPLLGDLLAWVRQGKQVTLYLPDENVSEISRNCGNLLAGLIDIGKGKFTICALNQLVPLEEDGRLLIGIGNQQRFRYWAIAEGRLEPGNEWATSTDGLPIIRSGLRPPFDIDGRILESSALRYIEKNMLQLHITKELNVNVNEFGTYFWTFIGAQLPQLKKYLHAGEKIHLIAYYDRYLRTPVHAKLLTAILSVLGSCMDEETVINLYSSTKENRNEQRQPSAPWHDWLNDETRRKVIMQILDESIPGKIDINFRDRDQIQHSRELQIEWRNGDRCSIRPDEGLGCWSIRTTNNFPFASSFKDQATVLAKLEGKVFMRHPELGTYLDCRFEES